MTPTPSTPPGSNVAESPAEAFARQVFASTKEAVIDESMSEQDEEIMELAQKCGYGNVRRVPYDPAIHGSMDCEPGDSIWFWGAPVIASLPPESKGEHGTLRADAIAQALTSILKQFADGHIYASDLQGFLHGALEDARQLERENARLNDIITGVFPETAALHEILRRAGCVSVSHADYDELQQRRAEGDRADRVVKALREALPHLDAAAKIMGTLRSETRPIAGHQDPSAIEDCWREAFDEIVQFEEKAARALAQRGPEGEK